MSRNLIVVDLETTGLGPQCAPIEVAAINVDTGETLEFVPYIDLSKVSIEPQAFAINRYFERGVYDVMLNPDETDDMWQALGAMLRDNKVENRCPHSALGDAEATAKAFVKLRDFYADVTL